jgi:type IV pilus assembly protein PilM
MTGSLFSLQDRRGPSVAVEIAGHRVSAVRLEQRGGRPVVAAHASEALPGTALVPALTAANVRDRATLVRALRRVLEDVGSPRRVGLVVPDPIAKVALVKFQQVPARTQDLDQLIRWQVKKAAPFSLDMAQVSYTPAAASADGQEFLVAVARTDIVSEYESLCDEAGVHAGLVDLSTFSVINAVLAGPPTEPDWLLVNVAPEWASLAIVRRGHVILFRSRTAEGEGTLSDLVHQTAMYYEDRLEGAGFGRVLVCGGTTDDLRQGRPPDSLRLSLRGRLNTVVQAVDPLAAAALADRIVAAPPLLDALAPLVGLLVRNQEAAA